MQRLHHRAEVLLQPGRRGRRDRQRMPGRGGVESQHPRDGRRRANRAQRRRAVPAALVVPRVQRPTESRLHLEADDVGVENGGSTRAGQLHRREQRRHQRRARMRERHEAHVVEVERVRGGTVGQRRRARAGTLIRADDRARVAALDRDLFADDAARGLGTPGQRHADGVEKRRRRAARAGPVA